MTVALVTPQIVTIEEARSYLRTAGFHDGSNDDLVRLLNGVVGWVYKLAERKRLIDDDTSITEYHDGFGDNEITTDEWPITAVTSVTLYPHVASSTVVLAGPGTAAANSEMIVDQAEGYIRLTNYTVPEDFQAVQVVYKAGFAASSTEVAYLKTVVLEALGYHAKRATVQDQGLASKRSDQNEWVFRPEADVQREMRAKLRRFRRLNW